MPTDYTQVSPLLAQAVVDMGLFHDIVHGDDTDTVTTDAGTVDSVAKAVAAISAFAAPVHDSFTGDGVETDWTLSSTPASAAALVVFVDDAPTRGFTLSGNTLTIDPAVGDTLVIETVDLSSSAAFDAGDLAAIAAIAANITTVAGIAANITSVAGDATDIGTVAADLAGDDDIGAVAAAITNINAVQAALTNINAVAGDATDIGTVATDLAGDDDIGTVAAAIANINTVEAALTNINAVAADLAGDDDIGTVATAIASVTSVAGIASDISAVAAVDTDVTTVADNIVVVAAAVKAAARAAFRVRFGKTPAAIMAPEIGDVSGLALTRATVGTAINEQGGPESAAINIARIQHDRDTGERLGLLLEPAGTNLVKRSADQSHADWVTNGGYFTRTGGQADPAGGTTATRLRCDIAGTTATNYLRQFTVSGGYTTGEFTFWARRVTGTGNVKVLGLNGATGAGLNITSSLTGDWQRLSHSGAAGGGFLYFGVGLESLNDEIDVAFFQCEGDITGEVSSFIETTTAAATRSADVATVDLSALAGFRPAGFTLLAEVILNGTDGVILDVGTGSTSEVALDMQSGDLHVTGADSLNLTAASGLSVGDRLVVAVRMAQDDVAVSVNGATVVTDSSHSLNGDADELQLGANISGADPVACIVSQVAFFGPLSNTLLEAMSNA